MDWSDKIIEIENKLGIENDRGKLARLLGIKSGLISDIKSGRNKKPGSDIALLLINKLGINPKWLEKGEYPLFLEIESYPFTGKGSSTQRIENKPFFSLQSEETGSTLEAISEEGEFPGNMDVLAEKGDISVVSERAEAVSEAVKRRFPVVVEGDEKGILIPVIGQGLSAGFGFDYDEGEVVRYIKIPAWIARKGRDLVALLIYGDSMEPTIGRGDLAVCVSGGFKDDGIYVLRDDERGIMFCKRVVWDPEGWEIISDNPRYKGKIISRSSLQIIARVIAAVKEVK
jgi:phage repressor protein C with HTH and peptisase S24 domain